LWDAFKKGTLIYLQQLDPNAKLKSGSCEMLSKKELWYICNNLFWLWWLFWLVVRCFQKRNFDIFATTLKQKKAASSLVVRCFQKRNFDIFATTAFRQVVPTGRLWDAFKKGTLIYLQQPRGNWNSYYCSLWDAFKKGTLIYLQQPIAAPIIPITCCEMLSKKELWYICNNSHLLEDA